MLCTRSPHHRILQLFRDLLVDGVTKVLYGARLALEHDWGGVVWWETSRLGVYSYEVESFPERIEQFVDV